MTIESGILMPKLKHNFRVEFLDIYTNKIRPGSEYITTNIIKIDPFAWGDFNIYLYIQDDLLGKAMDAVHNLYDTKTKFIINVNHLNGNDQITETIQFDAAVISKIYRDSWSYNPYAEKVDYELRMDAAARYNDDVPEWFKQLLQSGFQTVKHIDATMTHKITITCKNTTRINNVQAK